MPDAPSQGLIKWNGTKWKKWVWRKSGIKFVAGENGRNTEKTLLRLCFVHHATQMEWPIRELGNPAMWGERLTACATEQPVFRKILIFHMYICLYMCIHIGCRKNVYTLTGHIYLLKSRFKKPLCYITAKVLINNLSKFQPPTMNSSWEKGHYISIILTLVIELSGSP